ncbi:MAG: FAD-dependent oxidoreductase, partial [Holdemanella sp.]|nr:FAD-dependent oxidoreductase [Holdemanella sp.]
MKYEYLGKPITFRGMTVKNRIFLPPMKTNYAGFDHYVSEQMMYYLESMAKGGIGLITTEAAEVDGDHMYDPTILGIWDDKFIPGLTELANRIHKYDCKLSVQLIQGGPFANSGYNEGRMPMSSTPMAHVWNPMETPKEMTKEDIERYYDLYAKAALRAKAAGCDAVEVHCAHGHALLGSFLSPIVNHRSDEFGGDLKGRAKFVIEVCKSIREAVGEDFPVSVRLSADDLEEGGNTAEDVAFVCEWLREVGVDYIHFSNGTLYDVGSLLPPTGKPNALNDFCTDEIRKHTTIPFGTVGRIKTPWVADLLIKEGRMDMVYVGRANIADPEWSNKALEDRTDDIRACIGCLWCLVSSSLVIPMQCTMNPGVENYKMDIIEKADTKKKVVVIGAGPAGLEAATTAAKRGHDVTVIEKNYKAGGQFVLASMPPVKQELATGLKYLINEANKAGVTFLYNTEATVELVKELNPDEIIVATGAKPKMPAWITSKHPNVVSAWDILSGAEHPGL